MFASSLLTSTRTIPTEFSAFFLPKWRNSVMKLPAQLVPILVESDEALVRVSRPTAKQLERLARMAGFTS